MPFEVINIHVGGPESVTIKAQIQEDAKKHYMSLSAFMMWCYYEWKKREPKKTKKQ